MCLLFLEDDMFERKATREMERWFSDASGKALLIKGARQVGKSYSASSFAYGKFSNVVKFDLFEDSATRESFRAASSADDLMLRISVAASSPLIPGQTAVIIDEVQEAPNVLTFVKYLVQKGDFRFILTGSLLGVRLRGVDSLPVGYLTQVEMFPLDFEEFCWAVGLGKQVFRMAADYLVREEALPDFLYERLQGLYHRYLMVGGMPDAVRAFVETNNVDEVRLVHSNLHALYRDDIAKYAPDEIKLIVRDIYDLVPSEVASSNRRFKLSDISDVKRYSQVEQHFLWLTNAGVALPVYNVSAPVFPLLVSEQRNLFKLFYLDAGMLASTFPKKAYEGLLDGRANMNMGAAYEAAVAQELKAHGVALRYFSSKKSGELDFVLECSDGEIWALEVKSGSQYCTHKALDNALSTQGYDIDRAYVLAETNIKREGDILYMPVFLAGALER